MRLTFKLDDLMGQLMSGLVTVTHTCFTPSLSRTVYAVCSNPTTATGRNSIGLNSYDARLNSLFSPSLHACNNLIYCCVTAHVFESLDYQTVNTFTLRELYNTQKDLTKLQVFCAQEQTITEQCCNSCNDTYHHCQ